ncbi:hypothetical protein [Thiohalophilus thiocyanatoxydans]|uniref:Uncharacterized protein n=1 Tax=Thiohalophilus thiocyanatoxydans TaxID=381308 RepID=A0A4R8IXE0_9GAMM|nr:hypothetical protein [Thiohalophilus thiocyanatoxydans]TDY02449.1 hypothetical protein EDC23_0820 [Thiohalophilus thiocyanatoxydans]
MLNEIFMIVPSILLSALIWFIILSFVLWAARTHAHRTIRSFGQILHGALRLTSASIMRAESRLLERNREVLLNQGREAAERIVEREFERIDASVRKDLAEYPSLHRQLSEEITKIDEDYKESTEVPPEPPAWVKAVEAVAKIPTTKGDPMVGNVLEDIHQSLVKANTRALEEYRKASHKRHQLLNNMMPHWRNVKQILAKVDKNVNSLLQRSVTIDRHMEEYENIQKRSNRALEMLSSSSITQFFVSAFVLVIAIGGAMINFNLIALPMSEMVGAKSEIIGMPTSDVAALVIILVEIAMGIFLMESLRITRLFPIIGALPDKMRVRMIWITFTILFVLASVEAGLAYMREWLVEMKQASMLTGGEEAVQDGYLWITTAAQMGLGFMLPFALVFVAIPLESFVHSLRTVLGILGVALLRTLAWLLRFVGNIARYAAKVLENVYDLLIFAPLLIERLLATDRESKKKDSQGKKADTASAY